MRVRERGCEREREREHRKQWSVQSNEADGYHSLDRQAGDEEGEEETGLAFESTTLRNNIFKLFSKTQLHKFLQCEIAGSEIITVAHHDEPTVPDWNINMLAKEKNGACVTESVCCILTHIFRSLCEQHFLCSKMKEKKRKEKEIYEETSNGQKCDF